MARDIPNIVVVVFRRGGVVAVLRQDLI